VRSRRPVDPIAHHEDARFKPGGAHTGVRDAPPVEDYHAGFVIRT